MTEGPPAAAQRSLDARFVAPDDPRLDGLIVLQRDLARAESVSALSERTFSIGDATARLRFVGTGLEEKLTRAISHRLLPDGAKQHADVSLTLTLWDSRSTGVGLSPLLTALVGAMNGNPFSVLSPRQEIAALSNERVAATYELGAGVLTLYDRHAREAIYWVADPEALPYYELGAPIRTALNWWLTSHDMNCVHAAAVGTRDGAMLLTGKGGSGKSTTALACLDSGLQYLADDYCVFTLGAPGSAGPEVFSLYNTGKLRDDEDLERQPHCKPWIVNPDRTGDQKYLMYLHEHVPERLLHRAPLRAVVLPHFAGGATPRLSPVSPARALRALAPTSMFQLPGAADGSFAQMAALVKAVPCFSMECGTDLRATTRLLEDLHDRLVSDA